MHDAAINLPATPEQRDQIDRAATLQGKSRSEFMLEAACERASDVVLDQVIFSVNADRFQQFTAPLDGRRHPMLGCGAFWPCVPPPGSQLLLSARRWQDANCTEIMECFEILLRGLEVGIDQVQIWFLRGDAAFGLLLDAVQDINSTGELDGVKGLRSGAPNRTLFRFRSLRPDTKIVVGLRIVAKNPI